MDDPDDGPPTRPRPPEVGPEGALAGVRGGGDGANSDSTPPYLIGSVDHALRLLEAMNDHGGLRVFQAAELLGIARSSAHRLLATLVHRHFVVRDPAGPVYRIGPALATFSSRNYDEMDLRRIARPYLEELRRDTNETAHLIVLEGDHVRFIDGVESPQRLRVALHVGAVLPAEKTAAGVALLAALDETHAKTSRADAARFDQVRQLGYATWLNQSTGVFGLAVAIPDSLNRPIAALAMAAPPDRMPDPVVAAFAEKLQSLSGRIGAEVSAFRATNDGGPSQATVGKYNSRAQA